MYFWILVSFLLVGVLGVVDYLTGNEFSFSLFYLIPIALTTWYANSWVGMIVSVVSAITWLIADVAVGEYYPRPLVYFWNTLMRLGFFVIVNYLMSELRKAQEALQALSRVDYPTGAFNSRYFSEFLTIELERSRRYKRPFTLVYLD